MSTQTQYETATVTVRQHIQNQNLWGVTWKAGGEWAEIKDRLKELLYGAGYKYDANNKCWIISKVYTPDLEKTLLLLFPLDNVNWPGNPEIVRLQASARAEKRDKERRRSDEWKAEYERFEWNTKRQQEERQRQYSTANNTQTSPYAVLMVTQSAPLELCEVAYRYWAKVYHPDKGGSHEQMKPINNAIAEIRKVKGR